MSAPSEEEVEGTGGRAGLVLLGGAVVLLGLRLIVAPGGPTSTGGVVAVVLGIVAAAGLLHLAAARRPNRPALFGVAWVLTLAALLSSISLVCGATDH